MPVAANFLPEYAGVFRIRTDAAFTFVAQDGTLYGRLTGQPFRPLVPTAENTFAFPAVGAEFTFAREGSKITTVTLNQGGGVMTGKRTNEPVPRQAELPPETLSAFVGHYREARLLGANLEFDVRSNAGQLAVKLNNQPRFPVFPVAGQQDRFFYDVVKAELQFERDASGKVVALILYQIGNHRAVKLVS